MTDTEKLNKNEFDSDLSRIIENKHADMIRITNSRLVTLFWEIGNELRQFHSRSKKPFQTVISDLSVRLADSYGLFFTGDDLKKMEQFAIVFPDLSTVTQIFPFLSWEHFKLLLRIKDSQTRRSYIMLAVKEGITANELRKQIKANVFEDKNSQTGILRREHKGQDNEAEYVQIAQLGMENIHRNRYILENSFQEPLLSSFRQLLEPSQKITVTFEGNNNKPLSVEKELFDSIARLIETFRNKQNRWLNSFLTLSFGEIGRVINREIHDNNQGRSRKEIIGNAAASLTKKYGENFNEQQLSEAAKFAEYFGGTEMEIEIVSLVGWQYIIILLTLQNIEASLFYARLTAKQNLTTDGLRKEISEDAYGKMRNGLNSELKDLVEWTNPIVYERVEKKGYNTVKTVSVFIDVPDSAVVANIFENPYFPLVRKPAS